MADKTIALGHVPEENFYSNLIPDQNYALVSEFTLESGRQLFSAAIAFKTWGQLSAERNNVLIVNHALSGSSDVQDWWGPLLGPGKAFDTTRFFVFCGNILGSPYGSASPITINAETGRRWGPNFPLTTSRDDVRIQKLVLDALNVHEVAAVIGGSMGGFTTLEWPLCFPGYVRTIIPIATSASHSAWGIAWGEAQRRCIQADKTYDDGYYLPVPEHQPNAGLSAARMVGMLTYRSWTSFSTRFGRQMTKVTTSELLLKEKCNCNGTVELESPHLCKHATGGSTNGVEPQNFSAQGYLAYQAEKFLKRFDANCYIHLTQKMDQHDVTRSRVCVPPFASDQEQQEAEAKVLQYAPADALVVGVMTDVLFRPEQQESLARSLSNAKLALLESSDGHDGFLLAFESLGALITEHLQEHCPWVYEGEPLKPIANDNGDSAGTAKPSVFGELEGDAWA